MVEVVRQFAATDGCAKDSLEWLASSGGQVGPQRLERRVEPGTFAQEIHDEAEMTVLEGGPQCVEMSDEISPELAGHGGVRHLCVGEGVAHERDGIGPMAIQRAPSEPRCFGHATVGHGVHAFVDEQASSSLDGGRFRSFGSGIHGDHCGTTCATDPLRHIMCHMSMSWVFQAASFFSTLEQHNDRTWWQANRATYDSAIKPAFVEMLEAISDFGPWRVYRPNNDTRFSSGKGPYKTFIGAVAERDDGVGVFVQVSSRGLLLGTGMPMPAPDQLQRLRSALADPTSGTSFCEAVDQVRLAGSRVFSGRYEPLKRTPREYPADHPQAEFLRWKGVEIGHSPGLPDWLNSVEAASAIDQLAATGGPLHRWLGRHVGASALTAEERFAPKRRPANNDGS